MFLTSVLSSISSTFLLLTVLQVVQVSGKGGKGGGGGGKGGGDIGDSLSSLDLSGPSTALFAIVIVIAILTLSQMFRAMRRFKHPVLPPDAPVLDYQIGKLFPTFLFIYTFTYLIYNILYAVFVVSAYSFSHRGFVPASFSPGTSFVGRLSDISFLAIFLSILAYRQRIQLNPSEPAFNLKSFLDGWLLSTTLILGIASDALLGALIGGQATRLAVNNMEIAYQAFLFIASVDVIVSSIMVYARFRKSEVVDKIVNHTLFLVSPLIFILALYRIIQIGLTYGNQGVFIDYEVLNLVGIIIAGIVSVVVVEIALRMGALPKPPKGAPNHKA